MAIKLFDTDPYLTHCDAKVVECKKVKEGFYIYLDQTIFYPRGGGQPADTGMIDKLYVSDVVEDQIGIAHLVEQPLEVGKAIHCKLDFDFRFDAMQQHMGQHIFSRAAQDLYGAITLAARIEDGVSHVEFDRKLNTRQLFELQNKVNQIIKENRPIKIDFYTAEQAHKLDLPEKAFTHDIIRVVTIDNFDVNPCGGTHPASTGEVEKCIITGTKEVRGAFRIYYKFGKRAIDNRYDAFETLENAQELLGLTDKATLIDEIQNMQAKLNKSLAEIADLKAQLCESDAKVLESLGVEKDGYSLIVAHCKNKKYIKASIDKIILQNKCVVMVENHDEQNINVILSQSKGLKDYDCRSYVMEILENCPGKGGGSMNNAQCTVDNTEQAQEFIKNLFDSVK